MIRSLIPQRAVIPTMIAIAAVAGFALVSAPAHSDTNAKPMKVYILAGQSNMEGHAKIETFDYIGDDPATAPLLKQMRGSDGKARVCDHVWISYLTGNGEKNGEGFGKLTAGYGSRQLVRKPARAGDLRFRQTILTRRAPRRGVQAGTGARVSKGGAGRARDSFCRGARCRVRSDLARCRGSR